MKKQFVALDITQLEPVDELDAYELDLHNELRKGNVEIHSDKKTLNKYAKIFANSNHEHTVLNLTIPNKDYFGIKAKAVELGLTYQMLINSVIHRYLSGDLK